MAFQRWDGILLRGPGGALAYNPRCCCVPAENCSVCQPGTFSGMSWAEVTFRNGLSVADDCALSDCKQFVETTFMLPNIGVYVDPDPPNYEDCCYELTGALGCNVGGDGYHTLRFCWQWIDGINAQGVLTLEYLCNGGANSGGNNWVQNFTYSPNLHDCSLQIDFPKPGSNWDLGCTNYQPCDLSDLDVRVIFS